EEPVFKVADSDMPQDQEGNLGDNEDEPRNLLLLKNPLTLNGMLARLRRKDHLKSG
ncbi:hypothetical protein Tco_0669475, partial [Tanacetum coccineum]